MYGTYSPHYGRRISFRILVEKAERKRLLERWVGSIVIGPGEINKL
jgi:hypothetical protein